MLVLAGGRAGGNMLPCWARIVVHGESRVPVLAPPSVLLLLLSVLLLHSWGRRELVLNPGRALALAVLP